MDNQQLETRLAKVKQRFLENKAAMLYSQLDQILSYLEEVPNLPEELLVLIMETENILYWLDSRDYILNWQQKEAPAWRQ